jgi:scyllo-inositol 2-dehydrogenase (NADP+)
MRILIVGFGVQGRKRHHVAGNTVVGIVDPVAVQAQFKTIEEVPLECYDAACVCVPDAAKWPVLHYLLSHGKHVLVEKPLWIQPDEILELKRLSVKNQAACYTAYNHRFEPHIATLQRLLSEGTLGKPYLARFFYGNGTARDVRNSVWRDQGIGVIADLGSHLLDLSNFLFGQPDASPQLWNYNRFENQAPDHASFGLVGSLSQEMCVTFLSWRNTFSLDVFGELGSAHIQGLCKWGPSLLTLRGRVLPSGRPQESVETLEMPDPTWQIEHEHFLHLCAEAGNNLDNDLWIQSQIHHLSKTFQS